MAEPKTVDQKLDSVLIILTELIRNIAELNATQEEIVEKLANINVSGSGWEIEHYEDQN